MTKEAGELDALIERLFESTSDIGPWRMELLTYPQDAIKPFLSDFAIGRDYVDWLPDFYARGGPAFSTSLQPCQGGSGFHL